MSLTDTAPQYQLLAPLGEGGMAVVHLATVASAAGNRFVAIKRLARRAEFDDVARARLVAEAKLVFQLNHANVVQVIDLGESDDGTYIVMEYVHGTDLRAFTRGNQAPQRSLDPASCVYVAREVARALDYAHRRTDAMGEPLGIVHGDVTPQNILLSVEGEVKLADFGIARAFGTFAPGAGLVGGTPGYMAPEARASAIDHRADIFSLGATLYAALTGDKPDEEGVDLALLVQTPGVTPALRDIIARALAVDAADRWLSAGDMEQALAVELARRHPEFTPSVLARAVAPCARAGAADAMSTSTAQGTRTIALKTILDGPAPTTDEPLVVVADDARPKTATLVPQPQQRSRAWWWLPAAALAFALAGAVGFATLRGDTPATAPTPIAAVAAVPADAGIEDDEQEDESEVEDDATETKRASTSRRKRKARKARAAATEVGYLSVAAKPWGAVYIDGKLVSKETPLYRHEVPAGPHEVVVRFGDDRKRSAPQRVVIRAGQHRSLGFSQ